MSGTTLLRDRLDLTRELEEIGQSTHVSVTIGAQFNPWGQFDAGLRRTLQANGYQESNEFIEGERPLSSDVWHVVAPGIVVRESEYQARYGFLDMETIKQRMRPEVFQAFVRHIGTIEGRQGVDVNDLLKNDAG